MECYICCEAAPPPWRSACLCKDRFIHEQCLRKLLASQTGLRACPACAGAFQNVRRRHRFRSSPGAWLLALAIAALAGSCVKTVLHLARRGVHDTGDRLLVAACVVFAFFCLVGARTWIHLVWVETQDVVAPGPLQVSAVVASGGALKAADRF